MTKLIYSVIFGLVWLVEIFIVIKYPSKGVNREWQRDEFVWVSTWSACPVYKWVGWCEQLAKCLMLDRTYRMHYLSKAGCMSLVRTHHHRVVGKPRAVQISRCEVSRVVEQVTLFGGVQGRSAPDWLLIITLPEQFENGGIIQSRISSSHFVWRSSGSKCSRLVTN